ncbi:alpha/beta fold hydrolase [Streptomyces flavofungini]|uniref:alpha/beta fold hydrolase n=1 Tax=Streptomyces flavofungini TaxID=68200 RepID=UPI0034E04E4F
MPRVPVPGAELAVSDTGFGPPVVLLHGFPHTRRVWDEVLAPLAAGHRVLAPDLRGFGDSSRAAHGYDAATLASDIAAVLDAAGEPSAAVVALDAGVTPSVYLALTRPERVTRLAVMEAVLGGLPGAEHFTPPWWFGFHAVPGLAESVLAGHEAEYTGWFLDQGVRELAPALREAITAAYTGRESLRCAFSYYRALPESARQLSSAAGAGRLPMPVLALGAQPVGATLGRQLRPLADDLTEHLLPGCRHIIPLDQPRELTRLLLPFLAASG